MGLTCVVRKCKSRKSKHPHLSFYRFPADKGRRHKWVSAIRRRKWGLTIYSRICSKHFISGGKSDDPLSPDYVPCVFERTTKRIKRQLKAALARYNRRYRRKEKNERRTVEESVTVTATDGSDNALDATPPQQDETCRTAEIQTDMNLELIANLETECQNLRNENQMLRDKIANYEFKQESFKNDSKVKLYTGLPSFNVLMSIFAHVSMFLNPNLCLSPFKQFVMSLMRIRLDLNMSYLAHVFNVHNSTLSRIFHSVIDVLHVKLVPPLIHWPDRDALRLTMPSCFKNSFPCCVCIIDCFELFIEKPSDLKARAQTYSTYKSHNTVKYLIGITPQGTISFISKGWGGRTSDKHLTANSGFVNNLIPGDVVLADRGFNIGDLLAIYGCTLKIPAFTKGKSQLEAREVEETRSIAAVRIHVERIIGVTRQKYTLLQNIIPITFLKCTDSSGFTTLDKIVNIACALVNTCESVIPFE